MSLATSISRASLQRWTQGDAGRYAPWTAPSAMTDDIPAQVPGWRAGGQQLALQNQIDAHREVGRVRDRVSNRHKCREGINGRPDEGRRLVAGGRTPRVGIGKLDFHQKILL